ACSNLVDDYMGQIDVNGAYIAGVIRIVAQRANHPVIVHCTAGKDRTGVVTAMVLEILGISHQDIADDYHATAANMGPILAKIRSSAHFQENGLAAAPDWLFAADTATMAAFLVRMTDTYGSAHEWALQNGISAEELADLKTGMLGEGAESA
ncbi:MAG: tyrosine-protein phosphatase, partial [Actinomycetes bacterium]